MTSSWPILTDRHEKSEHIRLDRRPRPNGADGLSSRLAESWEEAHEVLVELEGVQAGSRALAASRAAGKSEVGALVARSKKGAGKGVCHNMRDKGSCSFGDECRFSHDPADIAEAKAKIAKEKEDDRDETQSEDEMSEGSERPQKRDRRKRILCKYLKDPTLGECPIGRHACPYSHNARRLKPKGRRAAPAKADDDDDEAWAKPVGFGHRPEDFRPGQRYGNI